MAEQLQNRLKYSFDGQATYQMYLLLLSVLTDIDILRQAINTHTHGGITAGGATSGIANNVFIPITTTNTKPASAVGPLQTGG